MLPWVTGPAPPRAGFPALSLPAIPAFASKDPNGVRAARHYAVRMGRRRASPVRPPYGWQNREET
jgi:hypothetical protein